MNTPDSLPEKSTDTNRPCPGCGGSGQTAYFGGESRFMFTWEDCPDCHGTGIVLDEPPAGDRSTMRADTTNIKKSDIS